MATAAKANAKPRKKKKSKGLLTTLFGGGRSGDMSLSFFAYVMILLVVGIVMMSSASYAWAYSEHGDGLYYAKNQALNAIIGFAAMIFFMKFDYHNFKQIRVPLLKRFNIAGIFYIVTAILLVAVLLIGNTEGGSMGAKRWITIGPIDLQPSEVAKLAVIVFFAYSMERDGKRMNEFKTGILKYAALLGLYVILIALEKHISGILLVSCIAISLILCGGANKRQFIILGAVALAAAIGYVFWQASIPDSYVQVRWKSFRDPFGGDMLNDTWQTANSLIAIGSGGMFGLGIGNSRQKYLYLPETKNDFVFPIVCEEIGFIGALAIIIVFFLLVVEGYSIAVRCKDRFGMLLAVGITTQIGIQTVLNLAVVSNLIPNTGISLPFFSYGGTALIMQLVEMGIMLNISKQRYYPEKKEETSNSVKEH